MAATCVIECCQTPGNYILLGLLGDTSQGLSPQPQQIYKCWKWKVIFSSQPRRAMLSYLSLLRAESLTLRGVWKKKGQQDRVPVTSSSSNMVANAYHHVLLGKKNISCIRFKSLNSLNSPYVRDMLRLERRQRLKKKNLYCILATDTWNINWLMGNLLTFTYNNKR